MFFWVIHTVNTLSQYSLVIHSVLRPYKGWLNCRFLYSMLDKTDLYFSGVPFCSRLFSKKCINNKVRFFKVQINVLFVTASLFVEVETISIIKPQLEIKVAIALPFRSLVR